MAWLLAPLRGRFDGGEVTREGVPLDLPWDGCELSGLEGIPSLYAAVATAEAKDWLVGVRAPLLAGEAVPDLTGLLGPEPVRQESLELLETALRRAHSVGARFLTLPWQPPAPAEDGAAGLQEALAAGLAAVARLQERAGVQVVLEVSHRTAGSPPGLPTGLLWGWSQAGALPSGMPGGEPEPAGTASAAGVDWKDPESAGWAPHLRLPLRWLLPGTGGEAPAAVASLLRGWVQRHPYGRLVLEPSEAGVAGAAEAVGEARRLLGRR